MASALSLYSGTANATEQAVLMCAQVPQDVSPEQREMHEPPDEAANTNQIREDGAAEDLDWEVWTQLYSLCHGALIHEALRALCNLYGGRGRGRTVLVSPQWTL